MFPGYFLTFLEAWGQGNIADDVRIFSESFNLQSVNYSLRFYVFSLPANVIYRIREAIGDFKQDYGRVKYGDWKYFFPATSQCLKSESLRIPGYGCENVA